MLRLCSLLCTSPYFIPLYGSVKTNSMPQKIQGEGFCTNIKKSKVQAVPFGEIRKKIRGAIAIRQSNLIALVFPLSNFCVVDLMGILPESSSSRWKDFALYTEFIHIQEQWKKKAFSDCSL